MSRPLWNPPLEPFSLEAGPSRIRPSQPPDLQCLHPTFRTQESSLIRTSICDNYSGSTKSTTHLDHISHCEAASGTNRSNKWTYRVFIISNHRDYTPSSLHLRTCNASTPHSERRKAAFGELPSEPDWTGYLLLFFITLGLELSDTKVYEP